MVLRPVRAEDAPALAAILAEPSVRRWWRDTDPAELAADEGGFVVVHDARVVGFVGVEEEDDPEYRHAAIDLFLATEHQGRGLGPQVLREVVNHLAARGHHRFEIDPAVDNDRAIRAYAKAGFRPVGVLRASERQADGTWADALLMDLVLPDVKR